MSAMSMQGKLILLVEDEAPIREMLRFALGRAVGDHPLHIQGQQAAVQSGTGRLRISWSALPERRIALLVMKRLQVRFAFEGLSEQERYAFMRPFDLTIQRGGG